MYLDNKILEGDLIWQMFKETVFSVRIFTVSLYILSFSTKSRNTLNTEMTAIGSMALCGALGVSNSNIIK